MLCHWVKIYYNLKALCSFETSVFIYPITEHNISEDMNLEKHQ